MASAFLLGLFFLLRAGFNVVLLLLNAMFVLASSTASAQLVAVPLLEAYAPARVSSVTLHLPVTPGPWASTCYGIVDGTWTPVPVEPGQAEAESARLAGGLPLTPVPELADGHVFD